jgi:PKD repeat protein
MIVRKSSHLLFVVFSLLSLLSLAAPLQAAQVQLSWIAPTTNANGTPLQDLAGYKVYYGVASRTYGTPQDIGKTTTYALSSLTSGQRYYVTITAYDTARNESSYSNEVNFLAPANTTALVANFTGTPLTGVRPLPVIFTDTSTGNPTSWSWNFGDGGTSTTRNPSHTYANAGTYTVRLTVSNSTGSATATKTGYITVTQTPVPSSGLVAAYSFEESSGSTVNDASGKANHGTISGAIRTTSGRYGRALQFDGVNDWVTIKDSSSLDLTTGMTLEAWVYPTALNGGSDNGWRTVILKQQPNSLVYALYANSDTSRPAAHVYTGADYGTAGGAQLRLNQWTHLASTYNGSIQRLYVNGSQVSSRSITGNIRTSTDVVRIGGNSIWGEYYQGRIDEVRIYNRALTVAEILVDMNLPIKPAAGIASMVNALLTTPNLKAIQAALRASAASSGDTTRPPKKASPSQDASSTSASAAESLTADHVETAEVVVGHEWRRLEFIKSFADPIVVAKALSYREAEPATVRIRGVDTTGFEVRLQSWIDAEGVHAPEAVGYLVIERGRYTVAGGTTVEAGTAEVDRVHSTVSLAFSHPFQVAPVVLTAVSSANGDDAVTGRPSRVSKSGFQFTLQQTSPGEEGAHETMAYIAWEPSSGRVDDLAFEVRRTIEARRDQFRALPFLEVFADPPAFLADIQATGGSTPLNLRWDGKDLEGVNVKIDDAGPAEAAKEQGTNVIGYIAIR